MVGLIVNISPIFHEVTSSIYILNESSDNYRPIQKIGKLSLLHQPGFWVDVAENKRRAPPAAGANQLKPES